MKKKKLIYTLIYLALIGIVIYLAFGGIQNKSLIQEEIATSEFRKKL